MARDTSSGRPDQGRQGRQGRRGPRRHPGCLYAGGTTCLESFLKFEGSF